MAATLQRHEFAPPREDGLVGGFAFAFGAHALLLAALAWGTAWNRQESPAVVEAELWGRVFEAAAPRAVEPPAAPAPIVQPPTAPPPAPKAEAVPVAPADISLQKREQQNETERLLAAENAEKQRKTALQKAQEADDKRKEALAKGEALKKATEKAAAEAEEKRLTQQREENLKRIAGLAGASGGPGATGAAQQSTGPSAGYAARIRARIKPNIVFPDSSGGNPSAEAEVRLSPDGTIISRRLLKPSGDKDWDEAVLRAIDRTEVLPRDENGRVPPVIVLTFRPRD
jgi:colicin import membrane protein